MEKQDLSPCRGRHCDFASPNGARGADAQPAGTGPAEPQPWHGTKDGRSKRDQKSDISQKLIINLREINHVMRSLYEGKGSQKRILIVLRETGTITQRELTERLGIQPGSASEVIAKLEDAGNIIRVPSESDRRTMDISLTEQGRLLAEPLLAQRQKRHEEMFSCLSEEEKNTLLRLLEKINADWETRYQEMGKEH